MLSAQKILFTSLGEAVLLFLAPALIYGKPNEVTATQMQNLKYFCFHGMNQ